MHSLANTKIEVSGSERTHETKCILQHSRPYVNAHSVVVAVLDWELFVNFGRKTTIEYENSQQIYFVHWHCMHVRVYK